MSGESFNTAPSGGSSLPPLSGGTETNPYTRLPRSNTMDTVGTPQRSQAYGMPQQFRPMYQNSGLARFGATGLFQPQAYQPRTYQPQALAPSRGLVQQGIGAGPGAAPGASGGESGMGGSPGAPGSPGVATESTPDTSPIGPAASAVAAMGLSAFGVPPGFTSAAINGINSANANANQAQAQNSFNVDAIAQADAQEAAPGVNNADPDSSGGIGASDGGNGQGGPAQGSNDGPGDSPGDSGGGGGGGGK